MFKKIRSFFLWILFAFVFISGLDYYRTRTIPSEISINLKPLNLKGELVDLTTRSQTKPLLVYFWATWCAPCKTVTPTVEWLAKNNSVVAVAMGSGTDEELRAYLKENKTVFEVVNDNNSELASKLNIQATPTVIIIRNGKVVSATMGISSPVGLWVRLKMSEWFDS